MAVFKTLGKIGGGGFGAVFECQSEDGTIYAKKLLEKNDSSAIERFVREVRILSALDHPNIVKVIDKRLSAPPYFFVMPLYQQSLDKVFPGIVGDDERIIPIFSKILDAIDYAHRQNVIHRDLKPSNVLLGSGSEVLISDFGYGRMLDDEASRLTASGQGFGTRGYACPEQWDERDAKSADFRCDIYALGIILYELYAGLLNGSHPQLDLLLPHIRLLVDRCLKKDPADRFQSIEQFKRSWYAFIGQADADQELGELRELSAQLADPGGRTSDALHRFAELLVKNASDQDVIHDMLLTAGPEGTAAFMQHCPSVGPAILKNFLQYATSQTWPFDRAKSMLEFCDVIMDQMADISLHATIMVCMILLASKNARLFGKPRKRLLGPLDNLLRLQLQEELSALNQAAAYDAYMQLAIIDRLPHEIRTGFESAIVGPLLNHNFDVNVAWGNFLSSLEKADSALFNKFRDSVQDYRLTSRTLSLQLKSVPVERLQHLIPNLEQIWFQANGWKAIFVLIP